MKVALLTDGIWPYVIGGMQKHSYYLCKYLTREKIHVLVFHPQTDKYSIRKQKEIFTDKELAFIKWVEVPNPPKYYFPGHYLYESYRYSKSIERLFVQQMGYYDMAYIQGLSGWYFLKANRKKKKPVTVLNMHGLNMFQEAVGLRIKLEQLFYRPVVLGLLKRTDFIQSLGGRLTDIIIKRKIRREKVLEIGIGVERHWLELTGSKDNMQRSFAFVGRYDRAKGINELNDVITQISKNNVFVFHFVGPIPKSYRLKQNNIHYHGEIVDENQIKHILDQSDFLVLPSYSEGMPTVILEAMARGCAIIATDVGAVSELISENNGFLIESHNESALISAFCKALILTTEELRKMQQTSKNLVSDRFIWDNLIKEMILKFENIIAKHQ